MSFIDLFNQAPVISKPFRCKQCRKRFRLKAHAVNHQRQSTNARCREKGFENVDAVPSSPRRVSVNNLDNLEEKSPVQERRPEMEEEDEEIV